MSYSCVDCNKSFLTPAALQGHSRVHRPTHAAATHAMAVARRERAEKHLAAREAAYRSNPRYCKNCGTVLDFGRVLGDSRIQFCNQSCSATYTNKGKVHSLESRQKRSASLKRAPSNSLAQSLVARAPRQNRTSSIAPPKPLRRSRPKPQSLTRDAFKAAISGPFTPLFRTTCAHCNAPILGRRKFKYCSSHSDLYGRDGRYRFAFSFNPFKYPEIFGATALEQLKAQGFWNPKNLKGLTRDHRVSVNEAIRNSYDPFYIKHPLNCQLMPWDENNRKNTESSISYRELVALVDAWEARPFRT